jgi:hypothetical protein
MTSEARRADRAVILGTDARDGSTVLVLPGAPKPVVVDATFVSQDGGGPASGHRIAVTLTVALVAPAAAVPGGPGPAAPAAPAAPAPAAPAAPTTPTGSGPTSAPGDASWHVALSIAQLVAATALGKHPADIAISAAPAIPDGAAASALLAAGVIAALTGEPLDPAATVIGALYPDGTIGPTAGIPEQVVAAIAHGKRRIGVPRGMRIARSLATGNDVDLGAIARARRAEIVELATVYDACRLMTRKPLPAPVPVSEADMALDGETLDGLRTRYLDWQKRLAGEWAPLLQLEQSGRLPAAVERLVRSAHQLSAQAESLYRAGAIAAAYRRVRRAWVDAASANDTHGVLATLHAGDVRGAAATLAALEAADASTGGLVARIGELRPATLAGQLAMISALHGALRGAGHRSLSAGSLAAAAQLLGELHGKPGGTLRSPATADVVASAVAPAAVLVRSAIAELTITEQELALAPDRGVAYVGSPAGAGRLARAFHAASLAAMRHVDALLVEPAARRASLSDDTARRRVASEVPGYAIADRLSRLPPGEYPQALGASWSADAPAAVLAPLAGYQLAHHGAALLAATHGSLSVHRDGAGRIDRVEPGDAFRQLLAAARHSARAAARAARIATGEIPVQARLAYQAAAEAAEGSDATDQLEALAELWTASAFSHAAVMLARTGP